MTNIYFVRHADSDKNIHDDYLRPLTPKGRADCALVTEFFAQDKKIDAVLSSPYIRAIDTVKPFAQSHDLNVEVIQDFRELERGSGPLLPQRDFVSVIERLWSDFSHTMPGGESLFEVTARNIAALNQVLARHKNKNIVIGTHGLALAVIIHHYDSTYGFKDFMAMVDIMPYIVKITFEDGSYINTEKINLFD